MRCASRSVVGNVRVTCKQPKQKRLRLLPAHKQTPTPTLADSPETGKAVFGAQARQELHVELKHRPVRHIPASPASPAGIAPACPACSRAIGGYFWPGDALLAAAPLPKHCDTQHSSPVWLLRMATQHDHGGVPVSVAHDMQQFRLLELPPEVLELIEAPHPPLCVFPAPVPAPYPCMVTVC